jgi:hypothetical protein
MTPYACHNRQPFHPIVQMQDGWIESRLVPDVRLPRMVEVPFRGSSSCNYTTTELGQVDERCAGCCHADGLLQRAPEAA